jgi:hypothetical protein
LVSSKHPKMIFLWSHHMAEGPLALQSLLCHSLATLVEMLRAKLISAPFYT